VGRVLAGARELTMTQPREALLKYATEEEKERAKYLGKE
jgi:hypothetical protein